MINEKEFINLVQNNELSVVVKVLKEQNIIPINDYDRAIKHYHSWIFNHDKNTKLDDQQMVNSLYNAVIYLVNTMRE